MNKKKSHKKVDHSKAVLAINSFCL